MRALFVIFVFFLIAYAVFSVIKGKRKFDGLIRSISAGAVVIFGIILAVFDGVYTSLCAGTVAFVAASYIIRLIFEYSDKQSTLSETMMFMSKSVAVLLVIEVLIFNINTYHLYNGNYDKTDLSIGESSSTSGLVADSQTYHIDAENGAVIEFNNIDKEIGTIKLDLSSTAYKADYSVDFTDETNGSYYMRTGLVKGTWYSGIESSKYIVCNFSGKVGNLRIKITPQKDSDTAISNSIMLNEDYPSSFSLLRMLVFLATLLFVRLFVKAIFMKRPVKEQFGLFRSATAVILIVCVLIMFFMTMLQSSGTFDTKLTYGNQISQELVDAFEQGKVTLNDTPSQQLLDMDNPYDWSARVEQGVTAKWDHVLYDGEYYSYYGVGPVVLLFLPYHMITGYYFPSEWATFLFSAIGLIFLGLLFNQLVKKKFDDMPMGVYIASLVMVLASCGIWYCLIPSNFYEIAQASGFCFVTLGAYFLITSNVITDGGISLWRLAAAALSLAVAVTCRPTTAIWCVVSLVFIFAGLRKIHKSKKSAGDKKSKTGYIAYLICALVPFVVIGVLQMIYNYARFDSFTDFGIQYSLTINDFINAQYHTQLDAIGFYDYLFAPPSFSSDFPYVWSNVSNLNVNGYYFIATNNGCGLLYRALPVFALFLSPYAIKHLKKENKIMTIIMFVSVAVVAPCIIIYSIWESGYGVRYMIDFAWQMLVCSLMVIFMFYRHTKHEETKRLLRYAVLIMMLLCVAVNFAMHYSYIYPGYNTPTGTEKLFETIARSFSIFNT